MFMDNYGTPGIRNRSANGSPIWPCVNRALRALMLMAQAELALRDLCDFTAVIRMVEHDVEW